MGYTHDDIEVLEGLEGIRRRPAMYIGDLSDPATLTCLVVETLCLAADELAAETATRATVTLRSDGTITVEDDGLGLSVDEVGGGRRHAEVIASQLSACRLRKVNQGVGEHFCSNGIVVTNALSAFFELAIARRGETWTQRYERGLALAPLSRSGTTEQHGTRISFLPDPGFVGAARVDAGALALRIAELGGPLVDRIALVDLRTTRA
jgi:DNA gyrase subunit B